MAKRKMPFGLSIREPWVEIRQTGAIGRVNSPVRATIALPLEGPLSRNPP
jgi:hypothetical protein